MANKYKVIENGISLLTGDAIYQIAKGDDIEPKEFFKILYQIILSTTRGPKIGPFILDIGKKNVADKISKYVR